MYATESGKPDTTASFPNGWALKKVILKEPFGYVFIPYKIGAIVKARLRIVFENRANWLLHILREIMREESGYLPLIR
jgi:hypothetical protein